MSIQKRDPGVPLSLLPPKGLVLTASEDSAALATELGFNFFPPPEDGQIFLLCMLFFSCGGGLGLTSSILGKMVFLPR